MDKWPEYSPYACWNCDVNFTWAPIGIPEKEINGKFYCSGNLCRFSCGARYLFETEKSNYYQKFAMLSMLYRMANKLTPTAKLKMSPPKIALIKYGGNLTYEQFHDFSDGSNVEIFKLPLIPLSYNIFINELLTNNDDAINNKDDTQSIQSKKNININIID